MPLIDKTYFKGPLTIAQITEPSVAADVDQYIAKYEAEFLLKLLGYELNRDFAAGLLAAEQKWIDLRDGVDYTPLNGYLHHWVGLKQAIANYVYFHYQRGNATFTTGTGEKVVAAQNAVHAESAGKQVRAWNEMVNLLAGYTGYMEHRRVDYPAYRYDNYYQHTWRGWSTCCELLKPINLFSI